MLETYTPEYLPYFPWDGTEPFSVILVAGDAGATCPPRARQWIACRQLVGALGGRVIARYAPTVDADDALPCQPLAHLTDDLRHSDGEASALVVFAPEVWGDGEMAVTAWMRELDVYYVHCPGGYRHPAMSAKLLEARWCRRQRSGRRLQGWFHDCGWEQRLYRYTRWWQGWLAASCQPVDGPEGFGYHRAVVDAAGYCRGRASRETPLGQAVLMPALEDIPTIQVMQRDALLERLGATEIAQRWNLTAPEPSRRWTAEQVSALLLDDTLTRIGFRNEPLFTTQTLPSLAHRLQVADAWPAAGQQAVGYLRGTPSGHGDDVASQRAACARFAVEYGLTVRHVYWDLTSLDAYAEQQGWQALLDALVHGDIRPNALILPAIAWEGLPQSAKREVRNICADLRIVRYTAPAATPGLPGGR